MQKTYITRMPDKAGAFLRASQIISDAGGNIVRVNYNRAVDTHTLFIEVSGNDAQHRTIIQKLTECGYLSEDEDNRRILMILLTLKDEPGAVRPVLEVLSRYRVNISYMSFQQNITGYQHFKMGLLMENPGETARVIKEISRICEMRVLDYEVTDRLLDGTVFYITFANEMRKILSLDQAMTNEVLICANRMMQQLDDRDRPVLQIFDYVRRFAQFVRSREGAAFRPNVTERELSEDLTLITIEPPCGSNTHILRSPEGLMFIDTGFACFRKEMLSLIRSRIPGFDTLPRQAMITHADVDHVGLLDLFGKVYMNRDCYENFLLEHRGERDYRESNPLHEPYCFLSKIISEYAPPPLGLCAVVGEKKDDALFSYLGSVPFGKWTFDLYEGRGGHVKGETVIVCEEMKLLFSGDIYVNMKGLSPEQQEFNRLAPFLMTGVDFDPVLCRESREKLLKDYEGFLFCPGHGAVFRNEKQ